MRAHNPLLVRLMLIKVLMVCFVVVLAGCVSSNPAFHNYRLIADSELNVVTDIDKLPLSVGVFPVSVAGWLDKRQLVWSDGGVNIHSSTLDRWGEPLSELMTRAMAENLQKASGTEVWISAGPWLRKHRPEMVAKIEVQSISIAGGQLNLMAGWTLEDIEGQTVAHRQAVYNKPYTDTEPDSGYVETLSQVWGLVATDIVQVLAVKQ
ncbi:PqiC family protein [Endozoicomonas ascidiicola]|uniref:PqiC family protein n=1 Tax=Endozoicomonas ascidiicola TaxID=1698521 RepID=UPI00082DBD40|nr:PqiC family protein [Endozoicomonas ascidiicola]